MESIGNTQQAKSDVIKEFRADLNSFTPEFQQKGLAIVVKLLPTLEAEYKGEQPPKVDIKTMVANLTETQSGYVSLVILLQHLVEKLAYHKPLFQKEIVATLSNQLSEMKKEYEEVLAREALIDQILNDIIRFMSTSQLVLLVKQLKGGVD